MRARVAEWVPKMHVCGTRPAECGPQSCGGRREVGATLVALIVILAIVLTTLSLTIACSGVRSSDSF